MINLKQLFCNHIFTYVDKYYDVRYETFYCPERGVDGRDMIFKYQLHRCKKCGKESLHVVKIPKTEVSLKRVIEAGYRKEVME